MSGYQILADGLGFVEGPVALPDGRIALCSISHGCVYLVEPGGQVQVVATGGGANGMTLGPDGLLYVAQNGGAWGGLNRVSAGVQVIDGERVEYLVDTLRVPNDLVFGPDGRLWVTDTAVEFDLADPDGARPGQVLAIDVATGVVSVAWEQGPLFTNGLGFVDDAHLVVTGTWDRSLIRYRLVDGRLAEAEPVFGFDHGPDGLTTSADGALWVALPRGSAIVKLGVGGDPAGRSGGLRIEQTLRFPAGWLPTNVCGDHAGTGLYVSAGARGALVHWPDLS